MYKIASVLVVDDDGDLRRVLSRFLTNAGYAVSEATNGIDAIAAYRAHPVDLVITDVYMPRADGIDVIMRLRAEFPTAKFIAISGGGLVDPPHVLAAARSAGAVWTLPKPFSKESLLRTLTDCLTPLLDEANVK